MVKQYSFLSESQVEEFLTRGYVRIPAAFSRQWADEWRGDVWTRLGMKEDDQSTWDKEWVNMPSHRQIKAATAAPNAWGAIGELVGGTDRIDDDKGYWNDGIIVNLGKPEYLTQPPPEPRKLERFHCDGDFFLHFLDSPEQALLVVPLFTDIAPHGGGTMIAPQSVGIIARYLAAHPEGVMPMQFPFKDIRDECEEFVELTGNAGDVILMHPLMLHSASHNSTRIPRMITNPPVSLRSPFIFDRPHADDYSLVELKTLRELGVDPAKDGKGLDWGIKGERKAVIPERLKYQAEWKKQELERLEKLKGGTAISA